MNLDDWPIPTRLRNWLRRSDLSDLPLSMRIRNIIVATMIGVPGVFAVLFGIIAVLPMWFPPMPIEHRLAIMAVSCVVGIAWIILAVATVHIRW